METALQLQSKNKRVVVLGGGTGSIAVIEGLKIYQDINLDVIVNMTDDGGSNEIIRDEFGLLPLSDIRKSIIALADSDKNQLLRQLFTYRFAEGNGLNGHTLGNLIMMALSDKLGDQYKAILAICELFDIKGNIMPITTDDSRLCAKYSNGAVVEGEHHIDDCVGLDDERISKLYLKPKANIFTNSQKAIAKADYIIIGPGDFYTTTLANIVVDGVKEALVSSKAKIVFITNLMSKKGETRGMQHSDFLSEFIRYTGRTPDYILVNNSPLPAATVKRYHAQNEHILVDDLESSVGTEIIRTDLINREPVVRQKGDTLPRSYLRHEGRKVGYTLYGIISGLRG